MILLMIYARTYVVDAESVRLALLAFVVAGAGVAWVFPPLVVQHLNFTLLLQLQNGQGYFVSPR